MDKKPIGVAVVGTGRWGTGMGYALQRCEEFQIVTCCTRTKARGDRFAQEFHCDHDATFHDVLRNDAVEAVLLTTPMLSMRFWQLNTAGTCWWRSPLLRASLTHAG